MTHTLTKLVTLARDHKEFGSVNPPTYRASTVLFADFDSFDEANHGRIAEGSVGYGRHGNPTVHALRDALSTLIDADHTVLTPSGLMAITISLLAFVKTGDHILMTDSVYGNTREFCDKALRELGVSTTYYDPNITPEALEALIQPDTAVIFLEAPGSLTFEMQDIQGLCAVAHKHHLVTMMDYTWATPLYIKPFALGVDIAIQAVTKYVSGHSDLLMGAASCKEAHAKKLALTAKLLGNYVGGDECSMALRGLRTMAARLHMQTQHTNAVLAFLQQQPEIAQMLSPVLPEHEGHALWKSQFSGACALFAIALKPDISRAQVKAFADNLSHFGMGFSWGGYESLIVPFQPASIRTATKNKWNNDQWIIRFHIGLEAAEDLIEDLEKGFAALRAAT